MTAPEQEPGPDLDEFTAAVRALAGPDADPDAVHRLGHRVLGHWREPGRGYHDDEHLTEVLMRLRELAGAGVRAAADPTVLLAAWFHDAVYAGQPGDDERASAALATHALTAVAVPGSAAQEVARLVLLTREHLPELGDDPGRALCDADLAILAAPRQRYLRYSRDVRREYRHVPGPLFRAGRRRVLQGLLQRARTGQPGPLFHTGPAQGWTGQAVTNLSAELRTLGADPG